MSNSRRMTELVTGGDDYDILCPLAIIHSDGRRVDTMTPPNKWITTSKFTLPEDWFVKEVPRKSQNGFSKYYCDPETGRQFRSLKDVERYLTQGFIPTTTTTTRSKSKMPKYLEEVKQITSHDSSDLLQKQDFKEVQDNEYQLVDTSRFNLPDGWIVTEVPRKTGHRVDRYFYEPGTGQQFRSLPSVHKHLAELEEEEDNSPLSVVLEELKEKKLPLSKAFKVVTPMKDCGSYDSWKKNMSKKEQDSSYSNVPPKKINWVIGRTPKDTWNAFVGDELVPDSVKQQWGKRFMFTINDTERNQQEWT
ncbi:methyl-CpG-binding domain-containing protein 7-like isoform X2 [Bidens hawaiensis]|uniref:methyl-CpG-binding domain-containing protein 7-like isoform X2 n=1 Tax=Bidens hawaiensis TaxID=980011 RepID=UPI0040490A3A